MKIFYLVLSLFISVNAFGAAGSGNVSEATSLGGFGVAVAGVQSAMPGGISVANGNTAQFSLYAGAMSVGNGVTYPFYKNGVLYQVTAGKTCRCDKVRHRGGSATGGWQLLSATATFANATATASLTGPVYQCGAAAVYCQAAHTTANTTWVEGLQYVFAASTWPGAQFSDNTQLYHLELSCHESP